MTIKRKEGREIEEITKRITHNKNSDGYVINRIILPNQWVKELKIENEVRMKLDKEKKQIQIMKGE